MKTNPPRRNVPRVSGLPRSSWSSGCDRARGPCPRRCSGQLAGAREQRGRDRGDARALRVPGRLTQAMLPAPAAARTADRRARRAARRLGRARGTGSTTDGASRGTSVPLRATGLDDRAGASMELVLRAVPEHDLALRRVRARVPAHGLERARRQLRLDAGHVRLAGGERQRAERLRARRTATSARTATSRSTRTPRSGATRSRVRTTRRPCSGNASVTGLDLADLGADGDAGDHRADVHVVRER